MNFLIYLLQDKPFSALGIHFYVLFAVRKICVIIRYRNALFFEGYPPISPSVLLVRRVREAKKKKQPGDICRAAIFSLVLIFRSILNRLKEKEELLVVYKQC